MMYLLRLDLHMHLVAFDLPHNSRPGTQVHGMWFCLVGNQASSCCAWSLVE
jgi:hypothetical protein